MQGKLKAALAAQQVVQSAGQVEQPPARSKFGNVKTTDETGETFDSKLEAKVYKALCAIYGKRAVWRQVWLPLPGDVWMKLDFVVVYLDDRHRGRVRLIDAKGMITPDWRNKAKIFRALYGRQIETVKHEREV
jgi:hypothetical protein